MDTKQCTNWIESPYGCNPLPPYLSLFAPAFLPPLCCLCCYFVTVIGGGDSHWFLLTGALVCLPDSQTTYNRQPAFPPPS